MWRILLFSAVGHQTASTGGSVDLAYEADMIFIIKLMLFGISLIVMVCIGAYVMDVVARYKEEKLK